MPGECFGFFGLLGVESRNENGALIADTNCDVLVISRKRFLWALQHFPVERVAFEQITKELIGEEVRLRKARPMRASPRPTVGAPRASLGSLHSAGSSCTFSISSQGLSRNSKPPPGGGGAYDTFRQVPFFMSSHPRFVELIARNLDDRLYFPEDVVCRQGEEGNCMYVLNRGEMLIEMSGHEVGRLGDGSVFGEVAVLGLQATRSATVKVLRVSWVRVLYKYVLDLALSKFPSEGDKLLGLGSSRMQKSIKGITAGLSKLDTS